MVDSTSRLTIRLIFSFPNFFNLPKTRFSSFKLLGQCPMDKRDHRASSDVSSRRTDDSRDRKSKENAKDERRSTTERNDRRPRRKRNDRKATNCSSVWLTSRTHSNRWSSTRRTKRTDLLWRWRSATMKAISSDFWTSTKQAMISTRRSVGSVEVATLGLYFIRFYLFTFLYRIIK